VTKAKRKELHAAGLATQKVEESLAEGYVKERYRMKHSRRKKNAALREEGRQIRLERGPGLSTPDRRRVIITKVKERETRGDSKFFD